MDRETRKASLEKDVSIYGESALASAESAVTGIERITKFYAALAKEHSEILRRGGVVKYSIESTRRSLNNAAREFDIVGRAIEELITLYGDENENECEGIKS